MTEKTPGDELEDLHYVTITPAKPDEDGWRDVPSVVFECRGDVESECHSYPACDCEYWAEDHEHPFVKNEECWMKGWFYNESFIYEGEDADDMNDNQVPRDLERSGPVSVSFDVDYVSFEFSPAAS